MTLHRDIVDRDAFLELIVIPDVNIDDIGYKEDGELHLCCNVHLIGRYTRTDWECSSFQTTSTRNEHGPENGMRSNH